MSTLDSEFHSVIPSDGSALAGLNAPLGGSGLSPITRSLRGIDADPNRAQPQIWARKLSMNPGECYVHDI